jgi:hypothetical protein
MKLVYLLIFLLTSLSSTVNAQWTITSGPIRPTVCFAKNSSYIFAGTSSASSFNGVYRTSNQGASWAAVNIDGVSTNIEDIVCVGEAVLAAQGNQIFLSLDNGDNWSSVSSNIGSYTITCLAKRGSEVFAAGQGIYYSNNLGLTWTTVIPFVNTGAGNSGLSVFGDTVFVGKLNGGLWRSINGGTTFSSVSTGLSGTGVTNVLKQGNVYLVGSSIGIYRSTNGGSSWQLVTQNVNSVNSIISSQNILFAAAENGVFFSYDQGLHWFGASDGLSISQTTTIFSDDEFLYAGVSQSPVYKRPLSDFSQPSDTCDVIVYDTTNVSIYDTTVVIQNDTNYVDVFDTTFVTLFDTVVINQFDTTYVSVFDTTLVVEFDTVYTNVFDTTEVAIYDTTIIFEYDTVLVTVDDTLIINTLITSGNQSLPIRVKIYPNPANFELFIESDQFSLLQAHQVKIFNSLGQLVFEQYFTENPLSTFIGNWGGNGIYFLHLVDPSGNTIEIKKIVLQN